MQEIQFTSCGVTGTAYAPASVEEFDKLAGKTGACLAEAVSNVLFRSMLPEFREKFCEAIATKYNVPRKTKPDPSGKKDTNGNPKEVFAETEVAYVERVAAQLGVDVSAFQPLADELCKQKRADGSPMFVVDPRVRERQPREATPGKKNLETAAQILNGPKDALKRAIKRIRDSGYQLPDTPTAEQLAWGIKHWRDSQRIDA